MRKQPAVFLETTSVIDLVFKERVTQVLVESTLAKYKWKITSRYVLYEICRGYIHDLILAYNKSLQCSNFPELLQYTRSFFRRPHRVSNMIEAYEMYFNTVSLFNPASTLPHNVQLLHSFRAWLRPRIRQGWNNIHTVADEIVNDLSCREVSMSLEHDNSGFDPKLETRLCGGSSNCGLKTYVKEDLQEVQQLIQALDKTDKDAETVRRIAGLKQLSRKPDQDFDRKFCWNASDALIALEAPDETSILTKNVKHYDPIAAVLGKQTDTY